MLALVYALVLAVFLFVLAWTAYNIPILAVGVKNLKKPGVNVDVSVLPFFSIVVPAKNEEKVVGRLLNALTRLNYPRDRFEVIVVVDGSSDRTFEICSEHARVFANFRVLHKPFSDGKPSALNFAVAQAKGDVLAFFDADCVPEADVLLNVSKYFSDPKVAAVQGRTFSINADENMLTRFIAFEEAAWCEAYLRGKDCLNLFVHLRGSCQFIRHSALQMVGGFDEKALSEDMEISARLTEKAFRIRYASDARAWQETPSNVLQLFRQRTRWYCGTVETALKYGRLMAKPVWRNLDAEVTLLAPIVLIASLACYFGGVLSSITPLEAGFLLGLLTRFIAVAGTSAFVLCGLAMFIIFKPKGVASVFWLPFLYFYWSLQAFIALYACMLLVFRKPLNWVKTEKTGTVANLHFIQLPVQIEG